MAVAGLVVLAVTVAVPPGTLPPNGSFPVGWLRSLVEQRIAWADLDARAHEGLPVQQYAPPPEPEPEQAVENRPAEVEQARAATDPWTTPEINRAGRYDPNTSVRVPERSTQTADTYRNTDGSYSVVVSTGNVNYQAGDGLWQPIDSTLVAEAGGRWRSRANPTGVSLAGTATGGRAGGSALATVTLPDGGSVSFGLQGAAAVDAVVSGSAATYSNVFPDTDLALQPTASGLKESIVLRSGQAANSWVFPLTLDGLTARQVKNGSIELTDAAGKVVATIPTGFMSDSTFDDERGEMTSSSKVAYELTTVDGGPALRMTADRAWLDDPARVYPVVVDPITSPMWAVDDVFVDNDYTGPSEQNGVDLTVGTYDDGAHVARSFLNFDNFNAALAGHRINAAQLYLYLSWTYDCNTNWGLNVHRVTSPWTVNGLAYSGLWGPDIGAYLGTITPDDNYPACTNYSANRSVGDWMNVWMNPSTFEDWSRTPASNMGLALIGPESGVNSRYGWKRITSRNYGYGDLGPHMYFEYFDIAPQVNSLYPPLGTTAPTLTPELSAEATDPDTFPNASVSYQFVVYNPDAAPGTVLVQSAMTNAKSWSVPAGYLTWGKTYLWTVIASDGTSASATDGAVGSISPVPPQPLITSGLAQNGGNGFAQDGRNYTASVTDAQLPGVGPALAVERSYNSLDPRVGNALGAGWSSSIDARTTEQRDVADVLQSVVVTYPNGQDVGFGRDPADGKFVAPPGRFSTLTAVSGGYSLVDKDGTTYLFTAATGVTGQSGLTSVADASGRTMTLGRNGSGQVTIMTGASGRALALTWYTPAGATTPHVQTVSTPQATAGNPATVSTWTYTHTGDLLTKVCPPTSATACDTYTYGTSTQFPGTVLNTGPRSYWRLGDASGAVAVSAVADNGGTDNGTYMGSVLLEQTGPLVGSTAKAVTLPGGTTSAVTLPKTALVTNANVSVSLWFKTTSAGILLSEGDKSFNPSGPTPSHAGTPLYVGTDGKLHGAWYTGSFNQLVSTSTVNNGQWHHVVLSSAGSSQKLYLDGALIGTLSGQVDHLDQQYAAIGGGYWSGVWPAQPSAGWGSLDGSIAEVALWDRPLTQAEVTAMYPAGTAASHPLTSVVRPSGNPSATIGYDTAAGTVKQVTDVNGGVWQLTSPTVGGTFQIHASAVLGASPSDYWRLAENHVVDAVNQVTNQVNGGTATYSGVTLGVPGGPFDSPGSSADDTTMAGFNGTSAHLRLPAADVPTTGPRSIAMWFKLAPGQSGVLFGYQVQQLPNVSPSGWVPALYVGSDGKLRGELWAGSVAPAVSANVVNDNAWHHVVLAAGTSAQDMYLDGVKVGTVNGAVVDFGAAYAQVGAGQWNSWPAATGGSLSYWPGQIAEVSYYRSQLGQQQVSAQFNARQNATGGLARTITVTDPANNPVKYMHDMAGRKLADIDALGKKTQYGYGLNGYPNTVTDPNGNVTTTTQDARGNTTSSKTCQKFSTQQCSTVYFTYFPDATTTKLIPDARNDVMLTMRDARSSSASDNTYRTSFDYDTAGNRTTVTDPLARVTTTTYTTASTPAYGGGTTKPGLPWTVTTAGGAVQTAEYYPNGDLARMTDPAGKVTTYTYNGHGRVLIQTETTSAFPGGLTTTIAYDPLGRPESQTAPPVTNRATGAVHTAVTTTVFTVDGQVESQTVTDTTGGDAPRTASWTYNARGHQVTGKDPVGQSTGQVTTLEYDVFGRIAKQIDTNGRTVVSGYDAKGHLTSTVLEDYTGNPNNPGAPVDQTLTTRSYDNAGRLLKITDAMNWETLYDYTDNDLVSKVTRRNPSDAASFVQIENTYDAAGNVTQTKTNNGVTTTTYVVDAAGRTTSSSVDPGNGAPVRTTTQTLSADNFVLNTTQTQSAPGGVVTSTDTLYDPLGRPLATSRANTTGLAPVARWKLDETTGDTAADSAGNSPATASGSVTWATEHGGAAVFNGVSTQISSPGPVVDSGRSFTVAAWLKLSDTTGYHKAVGAAGSQQSPFDVRNDSGRWQIKVRSTDVPDAPAVVADSGTSYAPNVWTHVVGVYDSATGTIELYVDGALKDTETTAAPFTARGPLVIGAAKFNGVLDHYWPGQISDVQVYQRALTNAEINSVYSGAAPAGGAGMVRTSWMRDQSGLATAQIDPLGKTTDYSYDEAGRVAVVTAPAVWTEVGGGTPLLTRSVSYTGYDTFGEVVESKDPNGNVTLVAYDAAGRPVSTTLPNYTPPGSPTPITAVASRSYDSVGQLLTTTDPLNHTTSYLYDQLGRMVRVTAPAPNSGVTKYTYDLVGDRLSVIDPIGAETQAVYDFMGRPTKTTQIVRQTGNNHQTTYGYSAGGWLASTQAPSGATVTTTYNNVGQPLTVNDGVGTTTFEYDAAGRQTKTTLPDNTYSTLTYNPVGWVSAERSYDPSNTLLKTRSFTHDSGGRVVAATDARDNTSTFTYGATGLLASQTEPVNSTPADSITTTFGYDMAGHRTRFTDGRGNASQTPYSFLTKYNTWGLPESQIEPETPAYPNLADRTFTAAYDANGRVTSQTSPGGVVVTNTYDVMGNLTSQSGTGAEVTTTTRTFDYDLAGRPTTVSGPAGANTFAYDDRGLLTSANGVSGTSSFTYTDDAAMASRTDAAGTTTYGHDPFGRLSTVNNTTTGVAATLSYNTLSLPTKITYGTDNNARHLTYDYAHRLITDELKTSDASGGTSIAKIAYEWDGNDNEKKKTTTNVNGGVVVNDYEYDKANRLKSWDNHVSGPVVYAYDKSGNRVQAGTNVYTYDERNQLKTSGGGSVAYGYTPRGTLSATTNIGVSTLVTKADAFGQILYQDTSPTVHQDYTYDGLGRLVRPGSSFTGAGNDLAADATFAYTRDPDGDLYGEANGATQRLVWTDQHSDVVAQFTATGTALTGSTSYDPLGTVLASTGMVGTLGFQSEYTDTSTGRVNMAARWYNTTTGQFDTRDSVALDPSPASVRANRFAYADANPLTTIDPSGHFGLGNVFKAVSSVVNTATRVVTTAARAVTSAVNSAVSWVADRIDDIKQFAIQAWETAKNLVQSAVNAVSSAVHWVAEKAQQAVQTAKQVAAEVAQRAAVAWENTKRLIAESVHTVADAYSSAKNWIVEHKDLLIEIGSIAAAVLAGIACTAVTAGVGAIACLAGTAALISVAKDAAKGDIHSIGDVFKSAGTGALQGALGGVTGIVGGRLASMALNKLGGFAAGVAGRALGGATAGGVGDATTQLLTTGRVDLGGVAMAAGAGAVFGAGGGRGGGRRGAAGSEAPSAPRAGHETRSSGRPQGCDSFAPTTRVLMADGSTKPIGEVTIGDKVKATDPTTGKTDTKPVTQLHLNRDRDLTKLTITAGAAVAVLETTQHHPFWDATTKQWIDAGALVPGQATTTSPDGVQQSVVAVENRTGSELMVNLTVADTHTYYVIAGSTPVLVHNCGNGASEQQTRLWVAGRPGVDNTPQDWIPMNSLIRQGGNLQEGNYHYVVMPGGSVRAFHESIWDIAEGAGHTSLSRGRPVAMAGTFDVDANGSITRFDQFSGHYRPQGPGLEAIARDALGRSEFDLTGAVWDPF